MSAPSKAYTIQLVKIQPEERLATTSELNPAPGGVTCHREARGMGHWAATQVKGLSPEIAIVSVADAVHVCGRHHSHNRYLRGCASPTGSETVARYQKDSIGTWETHNAPVRVWATKSEKGKVVQMVLWESDQFIVAMNPRNGGGAKGLAVRPLDKGHIHQTQSWRLDVNETCSISSAEEWEVWLKSRMRENFTYGSVRGLIVAPTENTSERRWL